MGKENDGVALSEQNIILLIPVHAVALKIEATVYMDGKLVTMSRDVDMDEIASARKAFLDNCYDDDYDATYEITPEYREFIENGGTFEEWMHEHGEE